MLMRVLKDAEFSANGVSAFRAAGSLVRVDLRSELEELMRLGLIGPPNLSYTRAGKASSSLPAPFGAATRRFGFFIVTPSAYSGGRIHLYQIMWTLAKQGAEVFLVTNGQPRWADDYPNVDNMTICIHDEDAVPDDLDVLVTDTKGSPGRWALDYKRNHPHTKLLCMNFETSNWVEELVPSYAAKLQDTRPVFKHADMLLANSDESLHWLYKRMRTIPEWPERPGAVIEPAVNTFALQHADRAEWELPEHPYAVYSGRRVDFKNADLIIDAVWNLSEPFDLVGFGNDHPSREDTDLHKFHALRGAPDTVKYAALREAHMTLAPSLFEGFGMVPAESLAAGTPVVVYDLPVLRQNYGEKLIYIPWNNPDAFKAKTAELASKPKRHVDAQEAKGRHGMEHMADTVAATPHLATCKDRPRISAHLVLYWGLLPEALESVYDLVDEILVAFGPTQLVRDAEMPGDDSWDILDSFPDPDGKLKIERRPVWRDKREMRNWCCAKATGNRMLLLDGDEVWVGAERWVRDSSFGAYVRWANLWHGLEHYAVGGKWGQKCPPHGSCCPHYRWSWWRPGYYFKSHTTPVDRTTQTSLLDGFEQGLARTYPEFCVYHFGYALPRSVMEQKFSFYLTRDNRLYSERSMQEERTQWLEWDGEPGPLRDGEVAPVNWELPNVVKRAHAGVLARATTPLLEQCQEQEHAAN